MTTGISFLWRRLPARLDDWIKETLDSALAGRNGRSIDVFFRADDIGVPGRAMERLLKCFESHGTPLSTAIVPAWLTGDRWAWLGERCRVDSRMWCWHQHGWRHVNHETAGRKQEFGPGRTVEAIRREILSGRDRLEHLMKEVFYPAFTPPWNRCGESTLRVLKAEGYRAISRTRGASPAAGSSLPDFGVAIDLHTRKAKARDQAWIELANEFRQGFATSPCGIMIHHRRMNEHAFVFLDLLLASLSAHPGIRLVTLRDLAEAESPETRQ
ncbi:MAG: hypothetical protein ACOWWM_02860 [Desulfobacterales bacterium]